MAGMVRGWIAAAAALAGLGALAGPAAAAPNTVLALGTGASANTLVQFTLGAPSEVTTVAVTGLEGGDTLAGIDYRPVDGLLYGLAFAGPTVRVYVVDPVSGVATPQGASIGVPGVTGTTSVGLDFNPVTDRLRVVTNLASDGGGINTNNMRVNPAGVLAGNDPDLNFGALPGGGADAPLVAVAHDRSVAGASATTAFGIVSGGDRLVRLGDVDGAPTSPTSGVLANVGSLGVNTSNNAGLDIDPETGAAYAVLEVAGTSRLYRVDLTTGAATPAAADNRVGDGTTDVAEIAIVPRSILAVASTAVSVAEGQAAIVTVTRTGPAGVAATVRYAVEAGPTTTAAGVDVPPASGVVTLAPGVTTAAITVPTTDDALVEGNETIGLRLSGPMDAVLSPGQDLVTVTVVDDDVAPPPPPPVKRPPIGLVGAPTQPIDRSLAGTFACTEACTATLVLRLGTRVLATVRSSLPKAGKRSVAFPISKVNVMRLRTAALGSRTAKLRLSGTFRNADGIGRSELRFALG